MKQIDLTRLTYHALIERKTRFELIEKTIGFGETICQVRDNQSPDCDIVLTSTGVMGVIKDDNTVITAWVANINQAIATYRTANGNKPMPERLWNYINYNNNTTAWQKMATA